MPNCIGGFFRNDSFRAVPAALSQRQNVVLKKSQNLQLPICFGPARENARAACCASRFSLDYGDEVDTFGSLW
jgi:hypothetical protein